MTSSEKATAANATEIVLRGWQDEEHLKSAFAILESSIIPVREHAVRVIASLGLRRAGEVFSCGGWTWAATMVNELRNRPCNPKTTVKTLVDDPRDDRIAVGLVIATLASEHDERAACILADSKSAWVRDCGAQLRHRFEHKWKRKAERRDEDKE